MLLLYMVLGDVSTRFLAKGGEWALQAGLVIKGMLPFILFLCQRNGVYFLCERKYQRAW